MHRVIGFGSAVGIVVISNTRITIGLIDKISIR